MPTDKSDQLIQLIKSLTKSEKRNFKLYAGRTSSGEASKFIQLFDILDKQKIKTDSDILKKTQSLKKTQLSNLKAQLYKQILVSLRMSYQHTILEIQITEQIDYAQVLYHKGLYHQSLNELAKAKVIAKAGHKDILSLRIIEFEKLIESRYITRSIKERADILSEEVLVYQDIVYNTSKLSNLALNLYSRYLQSGFAKNRIEHEAISAFYDASMREIDAIPSTFFEHIYYYQSKVWFYYITQDFRQCYRYSQKWVDLFEAEPKMKQYEADLYLKGLHNLLHSLFNIRRVDKFDQNLALLTSEASNPELIKTENTKVLSWLYIYTNQLNEHFLKGTFVEGIASVRDIERFIKEYDYTLDHHRVLVFNYKIACIYFGSGDNKQAIKYLNAIINYKHVDIHEDIQCFARILNLIAHFELENDDLIQYQVRSVYRYLIKQNDLNKVQQEILKFIRNLSQIYKGQLKEAFMDLLITLTALSKDPYEKRPFLYLDIISWLESKISRRSVQSIIAEKYLISIR